MARILTATLLLVGVLVALFVVNSAVWTGIVVAVVGLAAWEWAGFARLDRSGRGAYATVMALAAGGASLIPALRASEAHFWLFLGAAAYWAVLVPFWLWRRPVLGTTAIPLAGGMLALLPAAVAIIRFREESPALLLAVLAIIWISDTAAYFAGRSFGRRKLAPTISPAKTWEGVVGAGIAVTVYAVGWLLLAGGPAVPGLRGATLGSIWFVIAPIGLAAFGVLGDLLESLMKRQAGLKESGAILPGHGGVLDRIDSLLAALPLAALIYLP